MPPRKSDASKAATGDEGTPVKDVPPREGVNVEDLNLPKSIVTRLAKGVLPPNTQIQGNAMLAMTKSATVFVNYLATHANENAMNQNRKTIAPQDVFKALDDLEFPDFRPRLEMELARFNEVQTNKRNAYRQKVAADKMASAGGDEGEGPAAKKVRRADGEAGAAGEMRDAGAGEDEEIVDDEEEHEEHEEEPEEEDDDDEQEGENEHERLDVEEPLEEMEQHEAEDEALDNGEDSE